MGSSDYQPSTFEPRLAARWVEQQSQEPVAREEDAGSKPIYALASAPYPGGDLHLGHVRHFAAHDAFVRWQRLRGETVLNPICWDAFGLPAQVAAFRDNVHPREWTYRNIERQLEVGVRLGLSFDWNERLLTCAPDYYRWTQWVFCELYDAGLVVRTEANVNWCDCCREVLAHDEVERRTCPQCEGQVTQRVLPHWAFRITTYAQELLDGLEHLEWPEHVKTLQSHRIGRSEGIEIVCCTTDMDDGFPVFVERAEAILGATYFLFAPEHPLVAQRMAGDAAFADYAHAISRLSELDRRRGDGESGRPMRRLPFRVRHPLSGEALPTYAADFMLITEHRGAGFGVPADSERHRQAARDHALECRPYMTGVSSQDVVEAASGSVAHPSRDGTEPVCLFGEYAGLTRLETRNAVARDLQERASGQRAVRFSLRDWLVSRQRSWGAPIPIIYCDRCGVVRVPTADLPVPLPSDLDFHTTRSPLVEHEAWRQVSCPTCGADARRETDTLDTFVDGSWSFLRHLDPRNEERAWAEASAARLLPVDLYSTHAVQHAPLHLLYARFLCKALADRGHLVVREPYRELMPQGHLRMTGTLMTQRQGEQVATRELCDRYGADAIRCSLLAAAKPKDDVEWDNVSLDGAFRWLSRLWRFAVSYEGRTSAQVDAPAEDDLLSARHRAVLAVTEQFDRHAYNSALAELRSFSRALESALQSGAGRDAIRCALDCLLVMLSPMAPFLSEELWRRLGNGGSVHTQSWPEMGQTSSSSQSTSLSIQIDGRHQGEATVAATSDAEEEIAAARRQAGANCLIPQYRPIERVVHVPGKLVNFVLGPPQMP